MQSKHYPLALLLSALAYAAWSFIHPASYINWISETFPFWIGATVLLLTHRRFPFTPLTYTIAWLFSLILLTGGHYTYANVPLGNWARDAFHLSRNHFDRLGHVMQGVIPAFFARELLLRTSPLRPGLWLFTLSTSLAFSVSAAYELFEWQYAIHIGGPNAADFLGSQGDIWDAQQDMTCALLGALTSLTLLSTYHNHQLSNFPPPTPTPP